MIDINKWDKQRFIVKYGTIRHCRQLVNSTHPIIRLRAAQRGDQEINAALLDDDFIPIREVIAGHPNTSTEHLQHILKSTEPDAYKARHLARMQLIDRGVISRDE